MLKTLIALSAVAVNMVATSTAAANHHERALQQQQRHQHAVWVTKWTRADENIYSSIDKAAPVFQVSSSLLRTIIEREGGNINPRKLKYSLCHATQPGWNLSGSYAFGPFQFMLDSKPACSGGWGTFGSYVYAAFASAKRLGHPVPFRFQQPASNVGQAITAAYMIANGGLHHWCASMC